MEQSCPWLSWRRTGRIGEHEHTGQGLALQGSSLLGQSLAVYGGRSLGPQPDTPCGMMHWTWQKGSQC